MLQKLWLVLGLLFLPVIGFNQDISGFKVELKQVYTVLLSKDNYKASTDSILNYTSTFTDKDKKTIKEKFGTSWGYIILGKENKGVYVYILKDGLNLKKSVALSQFIDNCLYVHYYKITRRNGTTDTILEGNSRDGFKETKENNWDPGSLSVSEGVIIVHNGYNNNRFNNGTNLAPQTEYRIQRISVKKDTVYILDNNLKDSKGINLDNILEIQLDPLLK